MDLNSKQKSLCQLATTKLLPQGDKEKGKTKKMTKTRLGLMPQSSGSQFIQPCGPLILSLMVTTATTQEEGFVRDAKELKLN